MTTQPRSPYRPWALGFGSWRRRPVPMRFTKPLRRVIGTLTGPAIMAMRRLWGGAWPRGSGDGLCPSGGPFDHVKLWNTYHDPEHVPLALERTLADLRLDYLDLFLIHFPIALAYVLFETRYPPEWVYDPGRGAGSGHGARACESSGHLGGDGEASGGREGSPPRGGQLQFGSPARPHGLCAARPSVLQIEAHPYLTQERLVRLAQDYGLAVTAFSPLAQGLP